MTDVVLHSEPPVLGRIVLTAEDRTEIELQPQTQGSQQLGLNFPSATRTVIGLVIAGPPGGGSLTGSLMIVNRLNEFNTEAAKADARKNLGMETIDGGTFF